MNPYYQDDKCTLYRGNCRDISDLPSFDCVVTDPPYPDQYEKEYFYDKDGLFFLNKFDCRQFIFWSARYDFPLSYTAVHIWDKKMGCRRAEYEKIFERNGQNGYMMFREYFINSTVAANYVQDEFTGHPSQKPVKLLRKIINRLFKDCSVIFDPFMGSGSTGVAALKEGKKFIGVEVVERFFDIAKKRVIAESQKTNLFEEDVSSDKNSERLSLW